MPRLERYPITEGENYVSVVDSHAAPSSDGYVVLHLDLQRPIHQDTLQALVSKARFENSEPGDSDVHQQVYETLLAYLVTQQLIAAA